MFSDLKYIVFWWLTLFFLGSLSLPLVFSLFKHFWDRGYIFSKILTTALLTYVVFVLSVFKFLPFTNSSLFFVLFLIIVGDIYYLTKKDNFNLFKSNFRDHFKAIVLEEIIFFLILTFWSFIRGFSPDIDNLEKFMDWGFINSMLRTVYMPPADMWYSGEPINYYYFGHLIFAVLTKISGIASAITYNLSIATVCALTFVSGFSISSNLAYIFFKKKSEDSPQAKGSKSLPQINYRPIIIAGLISALLLTFGGNLHTVYKITKLNISQNGNRLVLTKTAFNQAASSYWYPDATRFIGFDPDIKDKTIHEFPLYSFVVADLHGHMNDIPIVLFFLAFLLALGLTPLKPPAWQLFVPSGLILSIAFMSNAWDFFVYGLAFAICLFFINIYHSDIFKSVNSIIVNGILTVICWYLFTLPFSLNFIPMADGIRFVDYRTPFYQLFVLYGGFWLICFPLALFIVANIVKNKSLSKTLCLSDIFALSLILVATILIILPELVYLKDIYIYEHRRANTMFKLVYQAFILFSLISGYAVVRLTSSLKSKYLRFSYKTVVLLVFTCHLIYPYFAVKSAYGNLSNYKGLWGLGFLKTTHPDNFKAIEWINKNIPGQPVMLEAAGDSYTYFNHVSVVTGLPTVEGWLVHEWLWHGGTKDANGKYINKTDCGDPCNIRNPDVQKIYESKDLSEVRSLIQKYSIDYIFIGDKEYEKYKDLNEKNFLQLGQIIFESGKTKIYKITK